MKSIPTLCALFGAPFTTLALPAPLPNPDPVATPPHIHSYYTASNQHELLVVAPQGPQTGYTRDLFPHWSPQSGACNTREVVLKRDGIDVVQDSGCAAVSGTWFSPYDGATWSLASDLDIDHVVPLSNAWKVRTYYSDRRNWSQGIHTEYVVWGSIMERRWEGSVCQWPHPPSTYCGDRQREPSQGR